MFPLTFIHGHTADCRPDVQPAAASSFPELPIVMMDVAGHTNRRAGILAHSPDFAALQPYLDILARHDLGSVFLCLLIFVHDCSGCSGAAAKHGASLRRRANGEDLRSHGYHVHGQAVSAKSRPGSQDTGINDASHAV